MLDFALPLRQCALKEVLIWSHVGAACVMFCVCALLKRNTRMAVPNYTLRYKEIPVMRAAILRHACVCVSDCMWTSEWVDQWSSSLFGWALCFDFFSSSLRSNASPLSYAARTSLEGLQSLSPSTDETPFPFTLPQLPLLPPSLPSSTTWLPVLICWSSPLCLTPPSIFESVMLRIRLGSNHCQFYQPTV